MKEGEEESSQDVDLYVSTNPGGAGSMEVNVFQRGCDVVIQKSLHEEFGLVVSEALWKETPVVAGEAGGIPMQFPDGFDKYLQTRWRPVRSGLYICWSMWASVVSSVVLDVSMYAGISCSHVWSGTTCGSLPGWWVAPRACSSSTILCPTFMGS